jgi:hypothetical protein
MIFLDEASIQNKAKKEYGYAVVNERAIVKAESYNPCVNIYGYYKRLHSRLSA